MTDAEVVSQTVDDRVVVITGAANGIGWATARYFAARGCRVALIDRDGDGLQVRSKELGADHEAVELDVADDAAAEACATGIMARLGRVDVLINAAGIADSHRSTLEQDMDHFDAVLDVSLRGTFVMSRAFGRHLVDRKGGAIVNFSSIAGISGMPRRNAYGAAKAGIIALTRSMACEWARFGVRINAVIPGYVETPLISALARDGRIDIAAIKRRVPLGLLAAPEDIAKAIWFLASDDARYITGTTLAIDGGWSAFGDFADAAPAEREGRQ